MSVNRKRIRKSLFYGVPAFITVCALYYIYSTTPFLDRVMRPEGLVTFQNGKYNYRVPLDPESPWPKFRANATQTGRSPVLPQSTSESDRKPWIFRTGKGIFSSAVVDRDGTVYIGSADHYFYAIRVDGTLKWKVRTDEVIDSAALLDDRGRGYVGSGDAHVYAIDRDSGKVVWKSRAHTVEEVQEQFDLKTYNVDWFEGNIGMLPDGSIIAPNDNYLIYALDRNTGERKQIYFGNELMWSLPAVNPKTGRIFSGSQFVAMKNIFAWDAETGEKIWASGGLGSNAASPLLTSTSPDGALVLGGYDGIVRAYSQDNGKELWSFGTRDHIYASPAQQPDGSIIQASADGSVYALNPENGEMIWQYDTLEPIRSSPAIDGNGVIYVGSGEGKLFAINPDGSLRWAYQCITEERNDLNGSPGLGYDGVYIAGESGEIFFVPYDYPLSNAGKNDPRSIQGPGEILPDDGVFLVWTGRFGSLDPEPPEAIDANEPIVLRIFVRKDGDTILSSFDGDSLEVEFSGIETEPVVALAANQRFLSLMPQETWVGPGGGELEVKLKGNYLVDQSRIGLKFFGGDPGGSFEETFRFLILPRKSSGDEIVMPYRIPKEPGDPATALEFSRLAAPNPTMLPSWNQIGFDSLHYLAGFVESSGNKAILWVIPGKLDSETGLTVTEPELEDRFVLELDYDHGLLSFYNYHPFILTFIGSWDMPFGKYRISTKADPRTGAIQRKAALNAMVLGDDLEFYGKFLKIMGLTDFWTGHMWVYGGMNAGFWNDGVVQAPDSAKVGNVSFRREDGYVVADIQGGHFKKGEHVFGILLVDARTGKPAQAEYARGIEILGDESGSITSVKLPLSQEIQGEVRAYYMVDTYPAARATLAAP